ncbi:MAG: putative Fe-S protein YdhL (DUF1289 family) [Paracoccaceae bacterium]|jgi:predicted Fe-S protein YdhL (DUF1289 family)
MTENDEIWSRAEVESPCTKVCVIHPGARICIGCLRTGDEIAAWSQMTPAVRHEIMAALPAREPLLTARAARPSARRAARRSDA